MKKKHGFTLVEIMIVVAIIALLASIGIPSFLNSREGAENAMKEVNIDSVNAAKDQWAILNNISITTSCSWDDIEEYLGGGINSLDDLTIDGDAITINAVGTSANY